MKRTIAALLTFAAVLAPSPATADDAHRPGLTFSPIVQDLLLSRREIVAPLADPFFLCVGQHPVDLTLRSDMLPTWSSFLCRGKRCRR